MGKWIKPSFYAIILKISLDNTVTNLLTPLNCYTALGLPYLRPGPDKGQVCLIAGGKSSPRYIMAGS